MAITSSLKCQYCKGTGRPQGSTLSCMVCHGKGRFKVEGKAKACPSCKGAGKRSGETLRCFTCGGKGFIEKMALSAIHRVTHKAVTEKREKILRLKKRAILVRPRKRLRLRHTGVGLTPAKRTIAQKNQYRKRKPLKKIKQEVSLWQTLKNILRKAPRKAEKM